MGMDGIIDPIIRIDQPIVISSEDPCVEFSKPEDIISLDERDDKSSDTNSSSLSSIIAEENGIGKQLKSCLIFKYNIITCFVCLNDTIYSLLNIHVVFFNVERHSSPTNCILNTVDGLLPLVDDVQNRLQQLNLEHKVKKNQ